MKERSILISGPNVRAILEGRLTTLRRGVPPKWTVEDIKPPWWWTKVRLVHRPTCIRELCEQVGDSELACGGFEFTNKHTPRSPFGSPGDRLWVRETWVLAHPDYHDEAEGLRLGRPIHDGRWCHYAATEYVEMVDGGVWRPSIHMPRWASRITLEITDVRVERAKDTTPNPWVWVIDFKRIAP